ncbi:Trm112 family protein [Bartonella sp. ML70XJBT.G]|uniref:Trm112 family protein n=1 Tax=Bartonella sp. ML70XJBT.G TaxID=3019093 RepID=UPI002361E63F|nr:Trm112 family protein [Bartonella sp. ML70XJBT.G]
MKKMTTDPKMLELLVCPLTGGTLSLNRNTQELISLKAKLAYPIRDGVPIMLASEARPLQDNEKATYEQ